jgi:hypothetical protein
MPNSRAALRRIKQACHRSERKEQDHGRRSATDEAGMDQAQVDSELVERTGDCVDRVTCVDSQRYLQL